MERKNETIEQFRGSHHAESLDTNVGNVENDHRREKRNRIIGMLALYSSIAAGALIAGKVYRYFQPRR